MNTQTNLNKLTKNMLLYFVRNSGIKGYSKLNKPELINFIFENEISINEEDRDFILLNGVRNFSKRDTIRKLEEIEEEFRNPSYDKVLNVVNSFLEPLFDREGKFCPKDKISYFERLSGIKGVSVNNENYILFRPNRAKQERRYKIGLHGLPYQHPFSNELSILVDNFLESLFDREGKFCPENKISYFEVLSMIDDVEITSNNTILISGKKYKVGIYSVL